MASKFMGAFRRRPAPFGVFFGAILAGFRKNTTPKRNTALESQTLTGFVRCSAPVSVFLGGGVVFARSGGHPLPRMSFPG